MESMFKAGQELKLTVLTPVSSPGLSPHEQPISGYIAEVNGPQLTLVLVREVPFAAPVKVESQGVLLLGDVCYCEGATVGFSTGVTARHQLQVLPDLLRLNESLRELQHSTGLAGVMSRT